MKISNIATPPCPLNAGKLVQVAAFVRKWRQLAEREAARQWRQCFQTRGVEGFEASATKGWTRPWVCTGESSVTLAQQIMAQVAGQLKGHMGQVGCQSLACGRKDDPRWQNPYFKAVLAALGGEVATPPSVFARVG